VIILWLLVLLPALTSAPAVVAQESASAPWLEKVPFSHKLHADRGLKCAFCHPMKGSGEVAGFPKLSECVSCHENVAKESDPLRMLAARVSEPEWQRLYRLPSFVFFGHRRHTSAGCASCHGAVAKRDVLTREGDISMRACINCHRQRHAPTACNTCHDLER
jgi:hypothetical protein